ncbi:MAG: glutathionylspermidine synthase family protein [Thermoplasmatota archaeon]|nr:glutathionylspermidine synthase family protein [Halobacteriales archaeon]
MRFEPLDLAPADFRERMERLRFQFGKWDLNVAGRATIPAGALVLSSDEHRTLVRESEALAGVVAKARDRLACDVEASVALDVPRAVAEAAAQEHPGQPIVTRIDFFRTREGWQVSECNDDCPGGYNEAIGLPAVLGDALPAAFTAPTGLAQALAALLRPSSRTPVGIVYATGYAEDLQVVRLLSGILGDAGVESVVGSPAHVGLAGSAATLLGTEVGSILRFFPAEWLTALPNWETWRRLAGSEVPMRNPLSTLATQSKAIHAWLLENAAAEAVVRRLLPATSRLDAAAAARAAESPHRWVLKPAFGRMGEGVVVGAACPPDAWRKRVASALRERRTRPFVLQERFDAVPVETSPGTTQTACVGAYVVGGRFAGYYSRLARGPVVAYDAANVLTVVEAA